MSEDKDQNDLKDENNAGNGSVDDKKNKIEEDLEEQRRAADEAEKQKGGAYSKYNTSTPKPGQKKGYPSRKEQYDTIKDIENCISRFLDAEMKDYLYEKISKAREKREPFPQEQQQFNPNISRNEHGSYAKNLAAFLSMIHSYSGTEKEYTASDYFESIERVTEMHGLDEIIKLNLAKLRLKDKVLNFARKSKLLDINDYGEFKKEIIDRFEPVEDENQATFRLLNSVQLVHETVAEYERRLYLDMMMSVPKNLSPNRQEQLREILEMQALRTFQLGLRPELAAIVRYRGAETLSQAAEIAKEEEKAIEGRKRQLALINPNYLPEASPKVLAAQITAPKDDIARMALQYKNKDEVGGENYGGAQLGPNNFIETRGCYNANDPYRCCCHLRKFRTPIPSVMETRLCQNECLLHSSAKNFPKYEGNFENFNYDQGQGRQTNFYDQGNFNPMYKNYNGQRQDAQNEYRGQSRGHRQQNRFNKNNNTVRQLNLNTGQNPHYDQQVINDNRQCHACGDTGHLRHSCQYYTAVCENCGIIGHIARACRKPKLRPKVRNQNEDKLDKITAMLTSLQDTKTKSFESGDESKEGTQSKNSLAPPCSTQN